MDIMNYITENCLIVVPVLYIIGAIIKAVPKMPDWIIPFVLLAVGMAACIGLSLSGQTGLTWIEAAIQGVLVTGAAVLVNQGVKQAVKRDA